MPALLLSLCCFWQVNCFHDNEMLHFGWQPTKKSRYIKSSQCWWFKRCLYSPLNIDIDTILLLPNGWIDASILYMMYGYVIHYLLSDAGRGGSSAYNLDTILQHFRRLLARQTFFFFPGHHVKSGPPCNFFDDVQRKVKKCPWRQSTPK